MWVGLCHPPQPVQASPENDISPGSAGDGHSQGTSPPMVMVATPSWPCGQAPAGAMGHHGTLTCDGSCWAEVNEVLHPILVGSFRGNSGVVNTLT